MRRLLTFISSLLFLKKIKIFFSFLRQKYIYPKIFILVIILFSVYRDGAFISTFVTIPALKLSGFVTSFLEIKHHEKQNIIILGIDDKYISDMGLEYGYLFPRDELANILNTIDSKFTSANISPAATFLDYDLSFSSLHDGATLSHMDKKLIDAIVQFKSSPLLLVSPFEKSIFRESLKNQKNVMFISVSILGGDTPVAMYQEYSPNTDSLNLSLPTTAWLLVDKKCSFAEIKDALSSAGKNDNLTVCGETLNKPNLVNNFIFTQNKWRKDNGNMFEKWDGISYFSMSLFMGNNLELDIFDDSVVFIGSTSTNSSDVFNLGLIPPEEKYYGIEVLSFAAESMIRTDGGVKTISAFMLIFSYLLVLLLSFVAFSVKKRSISKQIFLRFLENKNFFILIPTVVLFVISLFVLNFLHIWIDWYILMLSQLGSKPEKKEKGD